MLAITVREFAYDSRIVLHNVNISVARNEIVVVIGPNGSGKSTLLRVIAGLVPAPLATVTLEGRDVTHTAVEGRVRAGLCLVPQSGGVFPELLVSENLEMTGYVLRNSKALTARMVACYETFPILKERLNMPAARLSAGERQQLAVSACLMRPASVFLLDEPTLGLSERMAALVLEKIASIARSQAGGALLVEHRVKAAFRVADRVYVLRGGEIVFCGTPRELASPDRLQSLFIGKD